MDIGRKKPTVKGAAETFTGDVWIDSVAQGEEPSRVRVNVVRFTPGARTAWHSHALGRRSTSPKEWDGYSPEGERLPRSAPTTSSFPPRTSGTGTVPLPTIS